MDEVYRGLAGPFIVESDSPFLGPCRCWLTGDPERKILFQGSPREMGQFFEKICGDYLTSTWMTPTRRSGPYTGDYDDLPGDRERDTSSGEIDG